MARKLNLYYSPGACSLVPHILLHEAGVDHDVTKVVLKVGAFPAALLPLNPKARVPFVTLEDGVTNVTETPAILTLVAQLTPEKELLGRTPMEVVRTYEWLNWICGTLHALGFCVLFAPQRLVKGEELFEQVLERAHEVIGEGYEVIEEKLAGREWAVGDAFTAVDAYLYVMYRWGCKVGFAMAASYPNYAALAKKLDGREAVRKAVEIEGLPALEF